MPDKITLVGPEGDSVLTTPEDAQLYIAQGYQLDTPELLAKRQKDYQEQQKYGEGLGNEAEAFGASAVRAATMGASDPLLEKLGATKAGLSALEKYNPTADTAGGITGIVGSAFVPGLEEAGPVEGVSAAGRAIGSGVSDITRKLLGGVPKVAEFGSKLVGGAADTAAQAALYNAAQKIDENHLAGGNLQQGVENALATTGDALKFGAGLHAVTALAGHTALYGAQKAVDGLQNLIRDELVPRATAGAADAVAAGAAKLGEPAENFNGLTGMDGADGRSKLLDIPPPMTQAEEATARDEFEKKYKPVLQNVLDTSQDLAYKKFGGLLEEAKGTILQQVDPVLALDQATRFSDALHGVAQKMAAAEGEYSPALIAPTLRESDLFERKLLELQEGHVTAESVYDLMNLTKRRIDEFATYKPMMAIPETNAVKAVQEVNGALRTSLEDPTVWGQWGNLQKAVNGPIADFLAITGPNGSFRKAFLTDVKHGVGKAEMEVKGTAFTNMVNKISTERGQTQMVAINDLLRTSQGLIDAYRQAGEAVGQDLGHDKYVASLLSTANDQESNLAKLGQAQSNVNAIPQAIQEGSDKFGESARMRALANSPFVTGRATDIGGKAGVLGPIGGAALGATLGHVGLAGVGAVTAVKAGINALKTPLQSLQTIAKIEKFNQQGSRKIQAGITSFFKGVGERSEKAFEAARPIVAYEAAKEPYQKQLSKMVTDNGDPQQVGVRYHAALQENPDLPGIQSPIAEHAPQFTKAVGDQQTKVNQYLFSIFPKDQSQILGIAGGKFSKYQPSKTEMLEYQGKEAVAKDPLIIFDKMAKGTLSADDMAVVDKLWPEIANQARLAASAKAAHTKKDLTTKQKGQLAILLGHPVDDTQAPSLGSVLQKNFADQTTAKKAAQTKANEGITTFAKDSKTPSQALIK